MGKLERPEIGWLGELAVDEAVVVGSGGRLIPWIPLVDAHGVDRAFTWEGVAAPTFAQIKTSGFTDDEGRHRWELRVGSFAAYERFVVVLALFDPRLNQIEDVFWQLDSILVENLHAASTIPPCVPTSIGWLRHPRTRTGWHLTAAPAVSYGRDLLRLADFVPRRSGRCRFCALTRAGCTSLP